MATKLKCWRRNPNSGRGMVTYDNIDDGRILDITGFHISRRNKPTVWEVEQKGKDGVTEEFKTKSKALKFANDYMKKHDTC